MIKDLQDLAYALSDDHNDPLAALQRGTYATLWGWADETLVRFGPLLGTKRANDLATEQLSFPFRFESWLEAVERVERAWNHHHTPQVGWRIVISRDGEPVGERVARLPEAVMEVVRQALEGPLSEPSSCGQLQITIEPFLPEGP